MKKLFGTKQEATYWGVAFALFIVVILYTVFSLSFLGKRINTALFEVPEQNSLIIHFDFDKLNQVLMKKGIAITP